MSAIAWKVLIADIGKRLAGRYWAWRTKLAKQREEKKHEEAINFSNLDK